MILYLYLYNISKNENILNMRKLQAMFPYFYHTNISAYGYNLITIEIWCINAFCPVVLNKMNLNIYNYIRDN